MPVNRISNKKKECAPQKLLEIKQRQQNWLKQREQSKIKEESRPKVASAPSAKSSEAIKLSFKKKSPTILVKEEPEIQTRFKSWVAARENKGHGKEDLAFDDNLSVRSDAESELARLVTPTTPITPVHPVAEEEFSDLADKIANKVKSNLGLSHTLTATESSQSIGISEIDSEHVAWRSERCKTFTRDAPDFNNFGSVNLASHNCPLCRKIMLSSSNLPMMVIPCGHTLCRACSEGQRTCPTCGSSIVSLTVNIMLQQIIHEYHSHTGPILHSPHTGTKTHNAADQKVKQAYVKDKNSNKISYTSKLANLQTRNDILIAEKADLIDQQVQLATQIHQNQTQESNVRKQEQEVEKAILDLTDRLNALKEHRYQYKTQLEELATQKTKVDGKVSMLTTTLSSLSREIEKVALLAESENQK